MLMRHKADDHGSSSGSDDGEVERMQTMLRKARPNTAVVVVPGADDPVASVRACVLDNAACLARLHANTHTHTRTHSHTRAHTHTRTLTHALRPPLVAKPAVARRGVAHIRSPESLVSGLV